LTFSAIMVMLARRLPGGWLPSPSQPHQPQVYALSLAANCVSSGPLLQAAARALAEPEHARLIPKLAALVGASGGAGDGVQECLLSLVAGMCAHPQLRRALAKDPFVAAALRRALARGDSEGPREAPSAATGCLLALCAEPSVQAHLAAQPPERIARLLDLACGGAAESSGSGATAGTAATSGGSTGSTGGSQRLAFAGVLSRMAEHPAGAEALAAAGALGRLIAALTTHQQQAPEAPAPQPAQHLPEQGGASSGAGAAWAESAVRTVAQLAARPALCSSCGGETQAQAVRAMAAICAAAGSTEAAAGNAALCLGHFVAAGGAAAARELERGGAVDALVALVRRAARGSAAARNAAIALAKACAADDGVRERVRQLRGFEAVLHSVPRP
jgi:hypothetical protein